MKKYLILFSAVLFSFAVSAQSFVEDNFEDLMEAEFTTVVKISQSMFQYASTVAGDIEIDGDINLKDVVGGIKSFHLVVVEDYADARRDYRNGLAKITNKYDELIKVKSKDSNFGVYIDEDNDTVYEIVVIGAEEDEFFVGSLLCEINLEDITKIMSQVQRDDFKPFKKMASLELEDLKVYPNPVSATTGISLEVPKGMIGGQAQLVNSSGAIMKTYSIDAGAQSLDVDGVTPGYYVLSVENVGITLKKKVLVVE